MRNTRKMVDENRPIEEDPETAGMEDVEQDEEPVHDQLPSVEEAKANAELDLSRDDPEAAKPSQLRRCFCCACGCVCLAFILVIILAAALPQVQEGSRASGSNGGKSADNRAPTLAPGVYQPRFESVKNFLTRFSDIRDLDREGSPQNEAAKWIADQDILHLPTDDDGFLERYALAVFYFALDGANWPYNLGFLTAENHCKWFQVGFGADDKARYVGAHCDGGNKVKRIFFPEKWLKGKFPDELSLLEELAYISVYRNYGIDDTFPEVIHKLKNLEYLALHFCDISGPLPDWLGEMTALTSLVLSNNAFMGEIPSSIKKLTKLTQLFLDDNGLSGDIAVFKSLTSLKALLLEDNLFRGTLSESLLDGWKHLEILDASGNNFTSSLPTNLFSLKNLTVIDLNGNQMTGSIPELSNDNNALEFLALHENMFEGSIPSSISQLAKLTHLDLSSNSITGDFPSTMGSLQNLKYLFVPLNNFDAGTIPTFLKSLTKLEDLSLKGTSRTGTIATWLGDISTLTLLDLGSNSLHGTLPDSLGNLSQLKFLLLNRNEFHGRIPQSLGLVSTLDFLLLERNNFNSTAKHICDAENNTLQVFMADCDEIDCSCCSACCKDDVQTEACDDEVWLGSVDPIWETKYETTFYQFQEVKLDKGNE